MKSRRDFLKGVAMAGLAGATSKAFGSRIHMQSGSERNSSGLAKSRFQLLPLGAVRPAGWLRQQLQIQANGLSGHLEEVWADVGVNSGWLGGTGESWERGPYYLDGYVPLAYLLNDPVMKKKAQKWIDWTLNNQQANGMMGPASNDDWWPRMIMLKALMQYQEATGDPRVIPAMRRYCAYQLAEMPRRPLNNWGKYRWHDEAVAVLWLYQRTSDPKLLDLARLLQEQGCDWQASFADFEFKEKLDRRQLHLDEKGITHQDRAMRSHGVNNAMALKHSPVCYLLSGADKDRQALYQQLAILDRYDGLPNGMFSADEHFAGRDPSQGTELCAVVETMYSLEHAIAILGDPLLADRLERIAYNALPGATTDDMWAHQYDQQPNQVRCDVHQRQWSTNGPESNLYGLEPNFGCCTANFHQGWPKLTSSLWMKSEDEGLAAVAYAPCEVHTTAGNNMPVMIRESTEYPFREGVTLEISPERAAVFPIFLRVPQWASQSRIRVNGESELSSRSGTFVRIHRTWRPGDRIKLLFPMQPRISRWFNNSVVAERGPIVFSLQVKGEWSKVRDRGPASDWAVNPISRWNYGLIMSEDDPAKSITVVEREAMGGGLFTEAGANTQLVVKAKAVPDWREVEASAGPMPKSPVTADAPEETLTLHPYGSAKLRVTAFPQIL